MNQKLCLVAAVSATLMLSSCGKKLAPMQAEYFSTNPNPLEVVGQKVPATVTGKLPAKYFVKNAVLTVTPVLKYNGTEVASQSYTFQGEKVRGNNPTVSYEYGGTITIPASYIYVPEMAKSDLELMFSVEQGGKQYVLPSVKVANGVIATAALADAATVNPSLGADAFQRIISQKYAADIKFLINQANLRAGELNSDAMEELRKQILATAGDSTLELTEININSYASPDGAYDFNQRLAEKRKDVTEDYMQNQLKKDKIKEFGELTANFTAEDWEGFKTLVEKSDTQDKNLILEVLKMYQDPEEREREIHNMSNVFEQLAEEILPQLRYSRITAAINVIGKSDAEINHLYDTDPSKLNVEELLYAATLTDDNARRMAIYKKATELYPNDYRTWNDLGMTQYVARDYKSAKNSFEKATRLAGTATEPKVNLGLIDVLDNNFSGAKQYFGSAAGDSNINEALGVYYLKTGDNVAAARAFKDAKSNNAALSQILTKDYTKAKQTLAGISKPDATTYYLMAVLGARTNNESMLLNNLRQAVRLDSSLAKVAQNDLEFANFNISKAL